MLDPEAIPQYTGHLGKLETAYGELNKDAGHIRNTGRDVHNKFQGLTAYYTAPEAERLFATTQPVKDRADSFADDLETVSGALALYASDIRPLADKLKHLKEQAQQFVESVRDDKDWQYDGDKVDEHNHLRSEITQTVSAFWAAERTCHNKITALWGGTQMVAGDGSDRKNQYGFSAADMKNAKLPWGDPVEERHHWYEVGHWVKSFVWDGIIVDGVWGTIKGLGTLVGFGGWDAMGRAWKGLDQLATGLAITAVPGVGMAFWLMPDDKLPSWLRDSRAAMKETGKALVAWDEWGKNPARAAGAVTFNVLTTVFTGGAGGAASGAGKAGAVARALSLAGKASHFIDPMTYVGKAAGAGLSKIGDIAKAIKGVGKIEIPAFPDNAITLPEGTIKLPDGTVHLPDGSAMPAGALRLPDGNIRLPDNVPAVPEDSVKLPVEESVPAQYLTTDGDLLDHQGDTIQQATDAPKGLGDTSPHPAEAPHSETPVLHAAGTVGADHLDTAGHLGDNAAGGVVKAPDNFVDAGAHRPEAPLEAGRTSHDYVGGGVHNADHPVTTGHPGDAASGGSHADVPDHQADPDATHQGNHPQHAHDEQLPEHGDHAAALPHSAETSHAPMEPSADSAPTADDMGNGRSYEEKWRPESQIPAPAEKPGDIVLDTGDPVYFREGSTAIGYDRNTLVNYELVKPLEGHHDVVVHGNNQGYFGIGRKNHSGENIVFGEVHPTHVADAIRNNPSYRGGPVRLVSCHTGTVGSGAAEIPAAQSIANELGVPVKAPTNKVGVDRFEGPGQEPMIADGGYWRTFLPLLN